MAARESMIEFAIADFGFGVCYSKKAATAAYNIPRLTFIDRINGHTNARASHANQQQLTPLQEEFLADWILEEDTYGYPPSHVCTQELAIHI